MGMEISLNKTSGALVAAASAMGSASPRLRGATGKLEEQVEEKGPTELEEDKSMSKAAKSSSSSSPWALHKKLLSDPWLLRLGGAALAKTSAFAASRAKVTPDRIVGTLDIHGWKAPEPLPADLAAALATTLTGDALGDDSTAALLTGRIVSASSLPVTTEAAAGTQLQFEVDLQKRPVAGDKSMSMAPEGARLMLDILEARFATIAMGGTFKTEFDEALTASLVANGQQLRTDGVSSHFGDVRQARSSPSGAAAASYAVSDATSTLPVELYP